MTLIILFQTKACISIKPVYKKKRLETLIPQSIEFFHGGRGLVLITLKPGGLTNVKNQLLSNMSHLLGGKKYGREDPLSLFC